MTTNTKTITIRLSGDPKAASLTFDVVHESQAAIELDNGMGGPLRARFTLSKMPDGTLQNSIGLGYDIMGRTPTQSRIEPIYREDGSSDLCEVQDREDGHGGRVIQVLMTAATEPMGQAEIVLREANCALLVLIHTPAIRAFLEANDPQALRQAETASWRVSEEIKRQSTLVDSIPESAALDVTTTLADSLLQEVTDKMIGEAIREALDGVILDPAKPLSSEVLNRLATANNDALAARGELTPETMARTHETVEDILAELAEREDQEDGR